MEDSQPDLATQIFSPFKMSNFFAALCGFLAASMIFGALACIYYVKALKRVRTMQKYMQQDAAKIVHAAAKDIYAKP